MAVIIAAASCALFCTTVRPANLTTTPLTTVVVSGSSAYAAPRLFPVYRDQLGAPVSRDATRAITTALAALYASDGYVRPELVVDETLAAHGVLRVAVHEARVTRVVFDGERGRHGAALERIAARLEAAQPLRRTDIPQALRDMRAIAGLAISATTRRDERARNAYELVVRSEFSAVDGVVRMNNRGTRQVGPNFLLGQVFANGLLGRREKIGLIFAATTDPGEYSGGGLFAETALGSGGTRANALLFRSHSAPDEAPLDLDDEYTRERATLRISHPLRDSALTVSGAFDADELRIERAGVPIRTDRLRIVEGALGGSFRSRGGAQYSASLQLRKGLAALGAGLDASGAGPRRADFLLTQLQATALRRFAQAWTLRFDAFAQHSAYVLPDGERFKIGGDRLGRGFEVAEIAGDRGLGGKLTLRRDLASTESLAGRVSAYGFYDLGAAWKQDRPGRESAATAGVGFALSGAALTGYLEVAAPLTGPDIEGTRTASVFAEIGYRF